MSQAIIRQALENKLATLSPVLSTAYENDDFKPLANTPYQAVHLLSATPDNQTISQYYYKEVGVFQVTLRYPIGGGAALAQARAELTKTHFKRGTTITNGALRVIITKTPNISPAFNSDGRYFVPIRIYYECDINL